MSTDTVNPTEEQIPLQLETEIKAVEQCVREVIVTVPRNEVDRYLRREYDDLVPQAQLPGFRNGRAPRKLVEKQFKDRVVHRVKQALLMDSLETITAKNEFSAIGEPDFDFDSIKLPEDGDFKFQFKIEVRPDFETPDWKGLDIERPAEKIGDKDIDDALARVLKKYSSFEATDEKAEMGDRLMVTATFTDNEGKVISEMDEENVTLSKTLSFSDALCEDFGEVMMGVVEDETRKVTVKIPEGSDDPRAGESIEGEFKVVEVAKPTEVELDDKLLAELGDFESESELRDFVRDSLTKQAEYRTNQAIRTAIVDQLISAVDFEMPKNVVQRQTRREVQRQVLELRSSGFDDEMIRSYSNNLQQNAYAATQRSLKEHFILEQIAEDEKLDVSEEEFDAELESIAEQQDVPVRRVRAEMERSGDGDAVRNQIIEKKVIDLVLESAKVKDKEINAEEVDPYESFALSVSALTRKSDEAIPEAKYEDNPSLGEEEEKNS